MFLVKPCNLATIQQIDDVERIYFQESSSENNDHTHSDY